MDKLNSKIKAFRKGLGMTQVEMATTLGITQSAYQQIETSNTDSMRVTTLRKICQEFNLSADWLLGLERGEATEAEIAKSHQIRNAVYKATKALRKEYITEKEKKEIFDQLQAIIKTLE